MSEKWWDMSDDELDDLFREASDKVEIPFDSSAFDKLRHKIDNQPEAIAPKSVKKRWLLPLALLLLVGVGLVYYFTSKRVALKNNISTKIAEKANHESRHLSPSENIKSKNREAFGKDNNPSSAKTPTKQGENMEALSSTKNDVLALSKTAKLANLKFIPTKNTKKKVAKVAETKQEKIATTDAKNSISPLLESEIKTQETANKLINATISTESTTKTFENNLTISRVNSTLLRKQKEKQQSQSSFTQKQAVKQNTTKHDVNISLENAAIIQKTEAEEVVNRSNFFGINDLAHKNTKSLLTDFSVDLPPFIDSLPRPKSTPKLFRFGIRLVVSPDINSIEYIEPSRLSGSLGVLVEYKISKKLILQTGVIYSSKNYAGDFDYYHSWAENWQKYHPSKPTEVDGGCKVLDLPINIRLNILQKPRHAWFVSSGVSSYIMLNETYTYNYAWSPAKTVDWSDKSNFYWSTLNFSLGYEKQITKHLTLQFEPYFKTPLKSVGRGSVNLYSSGVLFSTKYVF
jgi:hypothetical protein